MMPISQARPWIRSSLILRGSRPGDTGFTLVEILVVLVIISIVVSITVLSIGVTGRDNELDRESRRIEGLLELLHERAVFEGRDFGVRVEPAAYEFLVYDTDRNLWLKFDDEGQYRRRDLPKGVFFQLQLDSQTVVLKVIDRTFKSDGPPPAPQLAIAASGEGTPFRLTLTRDSTQAQAVVNGDAMGKLSRQSSDQAAQLHKAG
jgi:general secretion pathway protein H